MKKFPSHFRCALDAAIAASHEIMRIYSQQFEKSIKTDGSPVTSADLAASKIISEMLSSTGIPIIGEEIENFPHEVRSSWELVWIVDPLDGTKEFIKKNGEFAVNIALVENGIAVFGIVASPVKQKILFGGPEIGAFYIDFDQTNDSSLWVGLEVSCLNSPIVLAGSRSHHSPEVMELIDALKMKFGDVKFVRKGSSLKFIDLALGLADVYPRYAPTMEWDIASGQAIINALGGEVFDAVTNQPLRYNKESLYNPHFLVKTKAYLDAEG